MRLFSLFDMVDLNDSVGEGLKVLCGTRLLGEVDRIGALPDEILVVILSLLSLKEATGTSVLSSRWSNLWKHSTNLNFDTDIFNTPPRRSNRFWDVKSCKYIGLVNSILQSYKALSLKQFRISFYVNRSAQCIVTKWLEFVFSRQVEELELDFLCQDRNDRVILQDLLRESRACSKAQTLIFFKSLKSLCLECLIVSGEDIKLFLHNCPLLEQLIIRSVDLTSDVEVCGASLMLSHLVIVQCFSRGSIKVSAPNLTWLRVDDRSRKLLLQNMPKLVRVDFAYINRTIDVVHHFSSAVSCYISQLKILNLTLFYPMVFLPNKFPEMPNLSKLIVNCFGTNGNNLLPLTAIVWASPRLQEFKLQFTKTIQKPCADLNGVMNVERSPHQHLKEFEFRGFGGADTDHLKLVTCILENCVALQKIILQGRGQTARDYAKQQLQGKVPPHILLHIVK